MCVCFVCMASVRDSVFITNILNNFTEIILFKKFIVGAGYNLAIYTLRKKRGPSSSECGLSVALQCLVQTYNGVWFISN